MLCSAESEVDGGGERKDKKRPPQMAFQISFQKVRSDSRCRIRRDVRQEENEITRDHEGLESLRKNAVQGERGQVQNGCVSGHCRAAANECVGSAADSRVRWHAGMQG